MLLHDICDLMTAFKEFGVEKAVLLEITMNE
jgi:hypothetical protein